MYNHAPETVERARRLRRQMSLPEVLLWRLLRTRPLGVKFRSQHPIDNFVADFYCHSARTVIEIDGISHDMGDQPEFDVKRDERLRPLGLQVLRIPARDVLANPEATAEAIAAQCAAFAQPNRTH
jgi:very-short-patch-repair endonuclease